MKFLLCIIATLLVSGCNSDLWLIDETEEILPIETSTSTVVDTVPEIIDTVTWHDDKGDDSNTSIIDIEKIHKTCHISKKIRWLKPIQDGWDIWDPRIFAIHSGEIYENSYKNPKIVFGDEANVYDTPLKRKIFGDWSIVYYDTWEFKLPNHWWDFRKLKDQEDYAYILRRYASNNVLREYTLWLKRNLSGIQPSSLYSGLDTYYGIGTYHVSPQMAHLVFLGYQEWYLSYDDLENDRAMLAFRGKLYNPLYSWSESDYLDNTQNKTFSYPRRISWWNAKTNKLTFTRQTNILPEYDENGDEVFFSYPEYDESGKAIFLSREEELWYKKYKDKYGPNDNGYVLSYNIETCTEN